MPQTVTASKEPMTAKKAASLAAPAAAAATAVAQAVLPLAPAVPVAKKAAAAVTTPGAEITDKLALVQMAGGKIAEFAAWAQGNPILVGGTIAVMGLFFWWSKKQEEKTA